MLASRHVGVMGVFPVLPDVFRLNLRLWDCLNRHFVSMVAWLSSGWSQNGGTQMVGVP